MDHKHKNTLNTSTKITKFEVSEATLIDELLNASLSTTPAVFKTAGWADGSDSRSENIELILLKWKS